jgi:hypothetical protein
MRLDRYVNRLLDTLYSRKDFEIEQLEYDIQEDEGRGFVAARVRYGDGAVLEFDESLVVEFGLVLRKVSYAYHFQQSDGTGVIRYDNTPHHPEVAERFPHHKHVGEKVEASDAPDLHDVLKEIDRYLENQRAPS